jgi:hypothetical protein
MSAALWRPLLLRHGDYLRERHPVFHGNEPSRDRVAVIVEPRRHELLVPVVRNVMHHLGPTWNLEVLTAAPNVAWLRGELPGCDFRTTALPFANMNQTLYNHLLMDPAFWWRLPEEHVLVFQTDCVMLRGGVEAWLGYDYVGANYFHPDHVAPRSGGVQGGFSLRRRSAMLACLDKVSWRSVQYHRTHHGQEPLECFHEDVFFTHACEILGARVPPPPERARFAIEAEFFERPIGHHGTTKNYFTREQVAALISHSADRAAWSWP